MLEKIVHDATHPPIYFRKTLLRALRRLVLLCNYLFQYTLDPSRRKTSVIESAIDLIFRRISAGEF